ncbi:MAG TPA: hypothetical protein VII11_03975 [Bacteroidota bacterium]
MGQHMHYVVDQSGKKKSIVIPIDEWERFRVDYQNLKNKVEVLGEVKRGVLEVRRARKNGKKLQSLDSFLNER